MIGSRQRAVRNAIAIDVGVALEASELLQVFGAEHLSAVELLLRILEWIRHPVVHPEIQVAHDKDRRLESLRKIEGLISHRETFFDARRKQHDVLRVTVR